MRRLAFLPIVVLMVLPSAAQGAVECGVVERNLELRTTAFADGVALVREGSSLAVYDDRTGQPVACSGGPPVVDSIDSIQMVTSLEENFLYLDMSRGPLAPDVAIDWPGGFLGIGGGKGNDLYAFGVQSGSPVGKLDADLDVDLRASDLGGLLLRGGGGADVLSGAGDSAIARGAGDPRIDALDTSMTIEAGSGDDLVFGGDPPDIIGGEGGRDLIDVKRGGRDDVDCGPGRDTAFAGRRDHLKRCELVNP